MKAIDLSKISEMPRHKVYNLMVQHGPNSTLAIRNPERSQAIRRAAWAILYK